MTNGRVEVITSVERRRRWSFAEKQQLVATTLEPGASVSAVAREAEISSKSALWLAAADARVGTDRFYADADCGRGSVSWFCRPWDDRDRVRGGSTDADLWQVDPATLTAVRADLQRRWQHTRGALASAIAEDCCGLTSFGVAGGLSPDLRADTCIVGSTIVAADNIEFSTDQHWSRALLRRIPDAIHGAIAGLTTIAAHPEAKRALHMRTGALAVDNESHVVASAAAARGLPMAAVRVIVDPVT
jgi:hypothetical protein